MGEEKLLIFDFDGVIVDSVNLVFKNIEKTHPDLTWTMYQNALHKKTSNAASRECENLHS